MTQGWGVPQRCAASDPAGLQCTLAAGHPGAHSTAPAAPFAPTAPAAPLRTGHRTRNIVIGVVAVLVLLAAVGSAAD